MKGRRESWSEEGSQEGKKEERKKRMREEKKREEEVRGSTKSVHCLDCCLGSSSHYDTS